MDDELLQLLTNLRESKNAGDLDDAKLCADQTLLWRNRLDYSVLEKCLKHPDEDIRLAALGLLVESKKSTLCFTKIELDFIIAFLQNNIGERMEYVHLIKKALKRIKESLAVLRRQIASEKRIKECETRVDSHRDLYEQLIKESIKLSQESLELVDAYREFYRRFREICVGGLRAGSTNLRRKSSLQMLLLGQEFLDREFSELPWSVEQGDELFDCLLFDTYETTKEIIYKIAKGVNPSLLKLDNADRVREIIDVALDLANCKRPIDSITASYMLKIALLSPLIEDVLMENYPIVKHLPVETMERASLGILVLVVERLKGPLELAEENILTATKKHSLYGYLFCIRNLLAIYNLRKVGKDETWRRVVAEIIQISLRLNKAVSQVVNNVSPEGHLPMDMEESSLMIPENGAEKSTVTPQVILLCSWRTVKEVSLLFGYLSTKLPLNGGEIGILNDEQLTEIGEHLVTLLFETKHRGAFEQAHVGFGQVSNHLWRHEQRHLNKLPKMWLHHLLLAVSGLAPGNTKLCATRRSASVPFMVQALVSFDPFVQNNPEKAVFHSIMKILLGFTDLVEGAETTAKIKSLLYDQTIFTDLQDSDIKNYECTESAITKEENITEIKTHTLNILRALFKHAQLSDLSKTYAADGIIAAIRSYDGKTWAERNAATLLFSSLITRIFGVQRTKDHINLTTHNKMTGRTFFERYPSLLPFMLNELRIFVNSNDTLLKPGVQSILLLLSRLYPSVYSDDADTKWQIEEFIQLVSACAKSKEYKTRELAARAFVPLLTKKTVKTVVVELFEKITPENGELNSKHGYALQFFEILKNPQLGIEELPRERIDSFLAETRWIIKNLEADNDKPACFPLATVHVDSLCQLIEHDIKLQEIEELFAHLEPHLTRPKILKKRPGREIYESSVVNFFVAMMENRYERRKKEIADDSWKSVLGHENVQVQIAGWSGVTRILESNHDKKLLDSVLSVGLDRVMRETVDPDLRDELYRFFYVIFAKSDHFSQPTTGRNNGCVFVPYFDEHRLNCLCSFIVSTLMFHAKNSFSTQTPAFMSLLGKAYGILRRNSKDCYEDEYKENIYERFTVKTWMRSDDTDCKIAILSVLYDIFVDRMSRNIDCNLSLDWWSCLLRLLVDDNSEVRREAAVVVSKIEPSNQPECTSSALEHFFNKFFIHMREKPGAMFAALFAWSTSISGVDFEAAESEVFNKCYNYETFEPLRISDLCNKTSESLLANYSIDTELPIETRNWLYGNIIDVGAFKNARELLNEYGKSVPEIDNKLDDIIDPMHNDKLVRAMTYERWRTVASCKKREE